MTITRDFADEDGTSWSALAEVVIVAHGKEGAVLAFRPSAATVDDALYSTVTFNSDAAANFALRTMSEKELRRRLGLARMAAGGV